MNIALIIPELGQGGAQRSLTKLAWELSRKHTVYVLTFHPNYTANYELPVEPTFLAETASGLISKMLVWRKRLKVLKAFKKENNIDVCISFLEGANYLNVLSKSPAKTIISVRGSKEFDNKIKGFNGWIRKRILIPNWFKKADKIVAVSRDIKYELEHYYKLDGAKISVVNNFYDSQLISNKCEESLDSEYKKMFDKPVICFSGRLHLQKEPIGLLRSFAILKKTKDARLLLLGDGALKNEIERECNRLDLKIGVDGDVVMVGYQKNPFKFIAKSNLFVLSSSWEGFPNALSEAILCKVPVLSTDCPTGPREILLYDSASQERVDKPILTKNGVILPLLNTLNIEIYEMWANSMIFALESDTSEQVKAAYEHINQFTADRMMKKWDDIIESLK